AFDRTIAAARKSSHRVFPVGVGSAVNEALLQELATHTGGACELVTPNEEMAPRIARHFARVFQPRARAVRVHWPQAVLWQAMSASLGVYNGDTLRVFAGFDAAPEGAVVL